MSDNFTVFGNKALKVSFFFTFLFYIKNKNKQIQQVEIWHVNCKFNKHNHLGLKYILILSE